MKILYCDCFSGISGDMFLAGMLDAGMPLEHLEQQLRLLNLPEPFELHFERRLKGPLMAGHLDIDLGDQAQAEAVVPEEGMIHSHEDHEPDEPEHDHEHTHDHIQAHEEHDHGHEHGHVHGRTWKDIQALITASTLADPIKATALSIFQRLAEAEGHVHGVPVEQVHFHEVGATDSILDTVGAAIGLNYFGIERVYASALPLGSGHVHTQHGLLPVPAPATLELLQGSHAVMVPSSAPGEMVTPTGAAILATLATFEQPAMTLTGLGVGAGHKELPWPNVLRLIFGETDESSARPMVQIETNIDDMNSQVFGHVMGKLFAAGALDVYFTPIQMKKNRPATMLSVMAFRSDEAALAKIILEETTTMGMRMLPIYRVEAARRMETVSTEYGEIPLKLKLLGEKVVQASPEYEVCVRLATEHGVPLLKVYQAAQRAGERFITR